MRLVVLYECYAFAINTQIIVAIYAVLWLIVWQAVKELLSCYTQAVRDFNADIMLQVIHSIIFSQLKLLKIFTLTIIIASFVNSD